MFLVLGFLQMNAQEARFPYKGSATIKLNAIGGNIAEGAYGVGYQYYFSDYAGFQLNLDILNIDRGFASASTEIDGIGVRLMPEIRYYTYRSTKSNYVSFYWSAALMVKYNNAKISKWESTWDDNSGQAYEIFKSEINNVFALGFMPQIGIEAYLDKQRRFLIDGTFGLGFANNWIRTTRDTPIEKEWYLFGPVASNNQYEGFYPYLNVKIALGYRIHR